MARIDYYDDPNAPTANSIVPASSAIVVNDQGEILLHRRVDNDLWALPGGGQEIGESIAGSIIREVLEETGLTVAPDFVVGIYSDPLHVFAYDDGEVRQEFSICMACRIVGGTLGVSDESKEVRFFAIKDVTTLNIHSRIRARILDYTSGRQAVLNPPF